MFILMLVLRHNISFFVYQRVDDDGNMDMYTRVKRSRLKIKRDMYGMPLREDEGKSTEDEETEQDADTDTEDSEEDEDEEEEDNEVIHLGDY